MKQSCKIDGCGKPMKGHGYCPTHLARFKKYGDPHMVTVTKVGIPLQFLRDVQYRNSSDCIEWPFAKNNYGYGSVRFEGAVWKANRLICYWHNGKPFKGAVAAHSCGNPSCVNPAHIRWATEKENCADKKIHGTLIHGEDSHLAKLSWNKVKEIRRSITSKEKSHKELAGKYGVIESTIYSISTYQTWNAPEEIL